MLPLFFSNGEVIITLPADEATSTLNFVLKDAATNTWYDCNNANYALQLSTSSAASPAVAAPPVALPEELCNK